MIKTPKTIDQEEDHGENVPQGFGRLLSRLGRFSWTLHNVAGHPLMELFYLIGLTNVAHWAHDFTIPRPPQGVKDRYDNQKDNDPIK